MKLAKLMCAAAVALSAGASFAMADSFSVSPTNLIIKSADAAAVLTVRSGGADQMQGQVRVMRWTRSGGKDQLTPTRDVVASPPVLRLARNQETTIRLVRVSNAPLRRPQECYRVLIDQLPGATRRGSVVKFTIRHSVPLCFEAG